MLLVKARYPSTSHLSRLDTHPPPSEQLLVMARYPPSFPSKFCFSQLDTHPPPLEAADFHGSIPAPRQTLSLPASHGLIHTQPHPSCCWPRLSTSPTSPPSCRWSWPDAHQPCTQAAAYPGSISPPRVQTTAGLGAIPTQLVPKMPLLPTRDISSSRSPEPRLLGPWATRSAANWVSVARCSRIAVSVACCSRGGVGCSAGYVTVLTGCDGDKMGIE